jgi:hypothetical protein
VLSYTAFEDRIRAPLMLFPPGATFLTGVFPDGVPAASEKWERQFRLSAYASYSGFERHQLRLGIGNDDLNMYRTGQVGNSATAPSGRPFLWARWSR